MFSHANPALSKFNSPNPSSFHTHTEYICPYASILLLSVLAKTCFPMVIVVGINKGKNPSPTPAVRVFHNSVGSPWVEVVLFNLVVMHGSLDHVLSGRAWFVQFAFTSILYGLSEYRSKAIILIYPRELCPSGKAVGVGLLGGKWVCLHSLQCQITFTLGWSR